MDIDARFERFARDGDGQALADVFDATSRDLLRLAIRLCGDAAAAEDLVQTTFVAAIESASSWDATRPVRPWLAGILANKARMAAREHQRRAQGSPAPARVARAPDDLAEARELSAEVQRALDAIEEPYRRVLVLHLRYGLAPAEIADALGRPAPTVRTQLRRGRERMRRLLPAGLVAGLFGALTPARGLAAVRRDVLARARPIGLVGGVIMKKYVLAAIVLVLLIGGGATWYAARDGATDARDAAALRTGAAPSTAEPERDGDESAPSIADTTGVRGRCVDFWTGEPIEGVVAKSGEHETRTDANGRFALAVEPPARVELRTDAYAISLARVPAEGDAGTVRMRPLRELTGIVLTPSGEPAPGATVVVLREVNTDVECARLVADGAGRFRTPLVDLATSPGPIRSWGSVRVSAYLPGFVEGRASADTLDDVVEVHLGPARAIRGRVLDAGTGAGIAGARLAVSRRDGDGWEAGRADAEGRFEIAAHPAPERSGRIIPGIEAHAEGYAPARILGHELRDDGNVLELEPVVTVRGRVVRASGEAARGVEVISHRTVPAAPVPVDERFPELARLRGQSMPQVKRILPACSRVRTDDAGAFEVVVGARSSFRIEATEYPFKATFDGAKPPADSILLTLAPVGEFDAALRVRVLDADAQPVPGAFVKWWALAGASGKGMTASPALATTRVDGTADVWTNTHWTRPVRYFAWTPTGGFGISEPVDRQSHEGVVEVRCRPGATVYGRLLDGPYPSGARVSVWWNLGFENPWRVQSSRLHADGRFLLPGLPAARLHLLVASPDGRSLQRELELQSGDVRDLGELVPDPAALVRGVVRDRRGELVAGAWVRWQPAEPLEGEQFVREAFVASMWESIESDANGAFSLPVWTLGRVVVIAQGGPFIEVAGLPKPAPTGLPGLVRCQPGDSGVVVELGKH